MNPSKSPSTVPISDSELRELVQTSDWEYHDADTQELTHDLHRYSGKFIPQIARRAIVLITEPGELVLDPYCGSGTTLVEGIRHGRRVIGTDLNPLATLISKGKITPISDEVLEAAEARFQALLSERDPSIQPSLFSPPKASQPRFVLEDDLRLTNSWYQKWFQSHVLEDLIYIDLAIRTEPHPDARRLASIALSDILRRSSNAHSGYPNVMYDKNAPEKGRPGGDFLDTFRSLRGKVGGLDESLSWHRAIVIRSDAASVPVDSASVDAVVTHPPYIGSVPYAEYGQLSLQWFGTDHRALDKQLTGGRRQSATVVDRFRRGYSQMFAEAYRVLKSGRFLFVMVGSPTVKGEKIDLAKMTRELAHDMGFRLAAETDRQGINRRADKMGGERLMFLKKTTC